MKILSLLTLFKSLFLKNKLTLVQSTGTTLNVFTGINNFWSVPLYSRNYFGIAISTFLIFQFTSAIMPKAINFSVQYLSAKAQRFQYFPCLFRFSNYLWSNSMRLENSDCIKSDYAAITVSKFPNLGKNILEKAPLQVKG